MRITSKVCTMRVAEGVNGGPRARAPDAHLTQVTQPLHDGPKALGPATHQALLPTAPVELVWPLGGCGTEPVYGPSGCDCRLSTRARVRGHGG